ncbi:pyridoxamine 5'-phosphate oxidase family protein [Streptomyces sp. A3M-1-3]|uniref:pyridoxamine 5'-phosphate oxidase family protein n=1 Tax=Streptomyces sp. A3M-1-3 TaxID=2962044 RepID=UPI0020B8A31A|nr:pyridoxamine 5'-phosphate oxidase family protein [Streptomyces sp. A3M-1-3]MCP3817667.1 pyridoxamine 5'-phosphate oxidase family protein [Streptomyces sp. A3M-1-3]
MTTYAPARSRDQRRQDVHERLAKDEDAWVATAAADGDPCLVPLSFVWHAGTLLMCTRRTNPTARNLTPSGPVRVTLGHTRDVVLVEGTAETVAGRELPAEAADAFAAKLRWDPRDREPWVYVRITPHVVKAWQEENELAGRELMRDGVWLD